MRGTGDLVSSPAGALSVPLWRMEAGWARGRPGLYRAAPCSCLVMEGRARSHTSLSLQLSWGWPGSVLDLRRPITVCPLATAPFLPGNVHPVPVLPLH